MFYLYIYDFFSIVFSIYTYILYVFYYFKYV